MVQYWGVNLLFTLNFELKAFEVSTYTAAMLRRLR